MLAMSVVEPVLVMCLIGALVGLLLRRPVTKYALMVLGVWLLCGVVWAALSWAFVAVLAPSEATVKWPDDLPSLLRAIALSGLVALAPALITGSIRLRRQHMPQA